MVKIPAWLFVLLCLFLVGVSVFAVYLWARNGDLGDHLERAEAGIRTAQDGARWFNKAASHYANETQRLITLQHESIAEAERSGAYIRELEEIIRGNEKSSDLVGKSLDRIEQLLAEGDSYNAQRTN